MEHKNHKIGVSTTYELSFVATIFTAHLGPLLHAEYRPSTNFEPFYLISVNDIPSFLIFVSVSLLQLFRLSRPPFLLPCGFYVRPCRILLVLSSACYVLSNSIFASQLVFPLILICSLPQIFVRDLV